LGEIEKLKQRTSRLGKENITLQRKVLSLEDDNLKFYDGMDEIAKSILSIQQIDKCVSFNVF